MSAPDYLQLLKQYWGYEAFRGIQEEIIRSVGEGKDTLGLMPTGGGKSVTFQVPALATEGICLVITPLIALMKDQVQQLRRRGIPALAIHAGMRREEVLHTLDNCLFGPYKFLYVSPERLGSELFLSKLRKMHVNLITVDESHCISQWGYDFRPAYLQIAAIRELLPGVPVLALTATATPQVVDDIQQRLHFREPHVVRMSFARKNLAYIVRPTEEKPEELLHILQRVEGSSVIYVRNRRRTQEVARYLEEQGIRAHFYHAGLDNDTRDLRQQQWQQDEVRVMVATNAFGMGIDKPDVRLVVHLDLPDSLEAYFQEAGRAGRDGKKAYAVVLYSATDKITLQRRVADSFPPKEYIRDVYEKLQYYYEMAMGDGQGCVREFDIEDFCRKFKYFPVTVDGALHLLAQAGYLEYTDEQENASRLRFVVEREELYRLHEMEPDAERLIQLILRSYTGLFTDYAFISEETLAARCQLTRRRVYELLVRLARSHIVSYIPRKKTPYIIYTRARVESRQIQIPEEIYEARKARYEARIRRVIEYATCDTICRSRQLLHYFGEQESASCGQCDVCIRRRKEQLPLYRPYTREELAARIAELTEAEPQPLYRLADTLQAETELLSRTLTELTDEGKVELADGLVRLIRKK